MTTNTHTDVKSTENIYPGIDAHTNKLASETPENFIKRFGDLISYAKSNNIEIHLYDVSKRYILPKRDLDNALNNLENEAYTTFYLNLQNKKLQHVKEDIHDNMARHMLALYAGQIIPEELTSKIVLGQRETKAVITHNTNIIKFKKIPKHDQKGKIILATDPKYKDYVNQVMKDKYSSHGLNTENANIKTIKTRLIEIGEEVTSINFVQQQKKDIEDKQQTYKTSIPILNKFFTEIIKTNSPAIKECVDNHEFSKAWHTLLMEQLITNDTNMTIISLNQNILNLTYDINLDNDFDIFYNRFTVTHALYLFKLWHEKVTYETIHYTISQFDDYDALSYINKNLSQEKQIQRIPDQVNYEQRFIQLRRAITGSHLQQTLQNYLATSQNHTLNGLVHDLKQIDKNCTVRHSATTATQLQNQNQSIVASSTSSAQTKSNTTITTTTTKEQPKSTRFQKLQQQVPSNFNHEKHCVSCFASGESTGKYKDLRGKLYHTHSSNNCLWKQLKAKQINPQDIEARYKERYDPHYQPKPYSSDRQYSRDKDSYDRHSYPSRSLPLHNEYQPQGNHTHVSNHDNRDPSPTHSTYSKRSYKSDNEDREQPHSKYQRQDYSDSRHRSPSPSPNYHDNRYSRS